MHEGDRKLNYLTGAMLTGLQVNGLVLAPVQPEVLADVDEVEFTYNYDLVRIVVRHTFGSGWGVRIAFSGQTGRPQRVERAELGLQPESSCVAWALALGMTAAYAILPASGAPPLLGGLLRLGAVERAGPTGLELVPFELRPDARYLVQLQWGWYPTPKAFSQERSGAVPSSLFVDTGEYVRVPVDEDVAVLVPDGVETTQGQDRLEVVSNTPGRYPFELRSSRGTTKFELQWVDPVGELLTSLVPHALARCRTAAGVVKLAEVAEALVVQHSLALNRADDPDDAAEALDLFTARLSLADALRPMEVFYLTREFDRLGEVDLLLAATRSVLAQQEPSPGLGIAATQLCLGLMASGREVQTVLSHLSAIAGRLSRTVLSRPINVAAQAAALEMMAVTDAGPGMGGVLRARVDATPHIAALGLHLGAGLTGQAVAPLPVTELSHLLAVFQLLPDALSGSLTGRWGCSAHALARRATPELLARLHRAPVGDAHGWLVLALHNS